VRALEAGAPRDAVPELVVVPGLGALGYLLPTVRACSAWTRVHLLDVPGFGHPRTARSPAGLADVADLVARWLEATRPRRVALLGHSTGAQAALRAALAVGEPPDAVVLAGPTFPPEARRWRPLLTRVARTLSHESFGEIRATFPDHLRARRRVLTFLRTSMSDAPEHRVGDLSCPVIIMRGEHDALADARWAARLAADARWPTTVTVPGAHNFMFTHPLAAADALRDTIAAVAPPRGRPDAG
jgi:pimeloyl-ACP methyl ester carboxylesterase